MSTNVLRNAKANVLIDYAKNHHTAAEMSRHFGGSGKLPSMSSEERNAFEVLKAAVNHLRAVVCGLPPTTSPIDRARAEGRNEGLRDVLQLAENRAAKAQRRIKPEAESRKGGVDYRVRRSEADAWQSIRDQIAARIKETPDDQ